LNRAERIVDVLQRNYDIKNKKANYFDFPHSDLIQIGYQTRYLTNHDINNIMKYCNIPIEDFYEFQINVVSKLYFEVTLFVKKGD
jgi:hypothetical protein